jgi:hypothetical protein
VKPIELVLAIRDGGAVADVIAAVKAGDEGVLDDFLGHVEVLWPLERERRGPHGDILLGAVTGMGEETSDALYYRAYFSERFAAARCISRLGHVSDMYAIGRRAERDRLAAQDGAR